MPSPELSSPESKAPPLLSVTQLCKSYSQQTVFSNRSLQLYAGETVAITGPSGCGKTTLLNLIAGLDSPDSGEIVLAGNRLSHMNEQQRTLMRRRSIGFIFQFFNLIPTLTAAENCFLTLQLNGLDHLRPQVLAQFEQIGLASKVDAFPEQLSGGEQQRVAIIRALAHRPALILADEPSGNLDIKTAATVADFLHQQVKQHHCALLMVTHSEQLASKADRVIQW